MRVITVPAEVSTAGRPSPLGRMHAHAAQLGSFVHEEVGLARADQLYGTRGVKYPMMALLVQRSMGPVRHALSQRTVAGGLKVVYAPGDAPPDAGAAPRPPSPPSPGAPRRAS
jgi:hypothetical protein